MDCQSGPESYRSYDGLLADVTDWDGLRTTLSERGMLDPDRYFVAVARWELCYKTLFALGDTMEVVCLGRNPVGFAPAEKALQTSLVGKDAIIVDNWWRSSMGRDTFQGLFASIEPLEAVRISRFGLPVFDLRQLVGNGLKTPFVARSHDPS